MKRLNKRIAWNFEEESCWIRFYRIELFFSKEFSLGRNDFGCGCFFFSLGWLGFGIIMGEHYDI